MNLFIGLMSGTSMDGIDAALVDVSQNKLIAACTRPYTNETYHLLQTVVQAAHVKLDDLGLLNRLLGNEFAQAANQVMQVADIGFEKVTAIGSHGQTIVHDAKSTPSFTMQLACPHTIAEQTGRTVVADFRTRDLVLGGQGAPLAPLYHQRLFGSFEHPIAVVNIGGIANVSFITLRGDVVTGYDTGPGNCLMDAWIQKNAGYSFDADGQWASQGKVIPELLAQLLSDPYFSCVPPKSIGKEYFSPLWLVERLKPEYKTEDVQATLLTLTAESITQAIHSHPNQPKQVILCGGGARNGALVHAIDMKLSYAEIKDASLFGFDPDYIEAMMFAWLAEKRLNNTVFDLHSITGAIKPAVLGTVYSA